MSQTLVLPPSVAAKLHDTCGACLYRHQDKDRDIVCRRYPPAATILLVPAPPPRMGVGPQPFATFPPIRDDMRACGEFKARDRQ